MPEAIFIFLPIRNMPGFTSLCINLFLIRHVLEIIKHVYRCWYKCIEDNFTYLKLYSTQGIPNHCIRYMLLDSYIPWSGDRAVIEEEQWCAITAGFIQINKLMVTAPYLTTLSPTNSYLIVPLSILNKFAVKLELLAAFHIPRPFWKDVLRKE